MSRRKIDLKNFLIYLVNKKYNKKDKIIRQINKTSLLKWKFYADLVAAIIPIKPIVKKFEIDSLIRSCTELEKVDTSIADKMIEEHKRNLVIEKEFRKLSPHIIIESYKSHCSDTIMKQEKESRQESRKKLLSKESAKKTLEVENQMKSTITQTAVSLIDLDKTTMKAKIKFTDNIERVVNVTTLSRLPSDLSQRSLDNLMSDSFCVSADSFIIRAKFPEALFRGCAKLEVIKKLQAVKPKPTKHTLCKIIEKDGMKVKCLDTNNCEFVEKLSYDKTNKNADLYPHHQEGFKVEEDRAYFKMHMKKGVCLMCIPYHLSEKVKGDFEFVSSGEEVLPIYYETVEKEVINPPNFPIHQTMIKKWETVKRRCQKPLKIKEEFIVHNKFEVLNQFKFDKVVESIYDNYSNKSDGSNKILQRATLKKIKKQSETKQRELKKAMPVDLEKRMSLNSLLFSIFSPRTMNSGNCLEKIRNDGYLTKSMLPLNKSKRIKIVNKIKGLLEVKDDFRVDD